MNFRNSLTTLLITLSCVFAVGCKGKNSAEKVCEDGCKAFDDCDGLGEQSVGDCRDECEDDLEDADKDCRKAFREYIDCIDDNDCSDFNLECLSEALGLLSDCEDLVDFDLDSDGDCCGAQDTCGWAEDGFCDCSGQAAWDAVDCQ